jgi:uncharacterized protein
VDAAREEGAPPPERADTVLYGPHGLRSGWRILLFLVLAFLAASVLGWLWSAFRLPWTMASGSAVALAALLAAGWVMVTRVDGRPAAAIGFPLAPAAARESLAGLALGGAALGAAVLLLVAAGTVQWVADEGTVPEYAAVLGGSLAFFAVAAAVEEALFRGYPFQVLVQGIGVWPAVVVSSALFAAAHGANAHVDWIALANIFIAGVMLAVAYLKTRSLWFATGVHLGWNWTMASLLDFPVSGFEWNTPLYSATVQGPHWWTGGPFGPEAGIPATLALLVLTGWMLRTRRLAPSPAAAAARPLVDDRLEGGWT